MGRNYFSKAGGPYFINDGFSKHHDHKPSNHKDSKPDSMVFIFLSIGFGIVLFTIASLLAAL